MDDVDPTGDRTYRGDDEPKVYFADLRHEVELAARRHAELSAALDIYADELSHIAFAVTGDRDGIIGFDQIVDRVKAVVAERDRLRAELHGHLATAADAVEAIDAEKADVEAERDRLRAVVEGDDRSLWAHVVMQIMLTIDGGRRTWGDPLAEQVISAVADLEAERDRLVEELRWTENTLDNVQMGMAETAAERDRLRAVVDAGVIEIDGHLWRVKRRDDVLGEVPYMHAILVRTQLDVSPDTGEPPPLLGNPDWYVCPDHARTGGYESCCGCGGWTDDDPDRGRQCSEASDG